MKFEDFLPKEDKKSLLLPKGIVLGMVIRAFVNFTNPPKEKRFIVVGFHQDKLNMASVLINSEINFKVNYSPELANQHLLFVSEGRTYLTKDSYIDCSEIHTIDLEEINQKINDKPEIIIGSVEKSDLDEIMKMLANSPVIKGKIKKRCGIYDYKP